MTRGRHPPGTRGIHPLGPEADTLLGPETDTPLDQRQTPPRQVMFLHVSVILFTGGVCPSACWDTPRPGADTPRQTPPGQTHTLGTPLCSAYWEIRSTSGRYASHWNEFLLCPEHQECTRTANNYMEYRSHSHGENDNKYQGSNKFNHLFLRIVSY